MLIKQLKAWGLAIVATVLLGALAAQDAFAQGYGPQDWGVRDVRRVAPVEPGVVVQVRQVTLHVEASMQARVAAGALAAGTCAGVTRKVGDWSLRAALSTACAMGGERAGVKAFGEQREATQVVVRMNDGRLLAVTQEPDDEPVSVGDAVYLIRSGQVDRIVKG